MSMTNELIQLTPINTPTMTPTELLTTLDADLRSMTAPPIEEVNYPGVEALVYILYRAANLYDCYDDPHACASWAALELAACLVDAGRIDETVAKKILDYMEHIARFALEVKDLSLDTQERLERIEDANDDIFDSPMDDNDANAFLDHFSNMAGRLLEKRNEGITGQTRARLVVVRDVGRLKFQSMVENGNARPIPRKVKVDHGV